MGLVLIGAAVIYGLREYTRSNEDLSSAQAEVTISAQNLMNAFTENEAAANAKYLNKIVRVQGVVKTISRDSLGSYSIELATESELSVISCLLDKRHNEDAKKVTPGRSVTITGLCTGALTDVVLVRSVISEQ